MYQKIHEEISILGIYSKSKFTPKKFKWKNKSYTIDHITLISDTRDGDIKKRLYSVISQGNVYRLEFNRKTEKWLLEEIWVD